MEEVPVCGGPPNCMQLGATLKKGYRYLYWCGTDPLVLIPFLGPVVVEGGDSASHSFHLTPTSSPISLRQLHGVPGCGVEG